MGLMSRLKSTPAGGAKARTISAQTIDSVVTLVLGDDTNHYLIALTTTTVVKVTTPTIQPGRRVTLIGNADAAMAFQNNSGTTTKGQMDFGGTNAIMLNKQVLELLQQPDGTWRGTGSIVGSGDFTGTLGADVSISDAGDTLLLLAGDGVTEISTIGATDPIVPGRRVTIMNTDANVLILVNNSNTTTAGQMDLRHSNRNVTKDGTVSLIQLSSGAWRLTSMAL